ncbi:MAG: hypothetical protein AAGJ31_14930 [Verrucomicrobiota bacterium]
MIQQFWSTTVPNAPWHCLRIAQKDLPQRAFFTAEVSEVIGIVDLPHQRTTAGGARFDESLDLHRIPRRLNLLCHPFDAAVGL